MRIAVFTVMAALSAAQATAQSSGPPAPRLEFAFEEVVLLGEAVAPGETPFGRRNIIPIIGGSFEGPGIKGAIVPGGWDWQLVRADGCVDVKADYMLRTDDGVTINVVNTGALCMPKPGEAPVAARTSPRFEAPLGKYAWLNRTAFIGTLERATGPKGEPAVRIRFYKAV
ncbi:DUF3237 domain-containing protein [Sphingobium nicotianae]|uniref:UPF0311 protein KK488_15025 n=1 Tax=Sphingobium nicotianae TaxID=2782607 RepID=A0A9X1DDN9_9SPHN|nr:DUF3237 domain-containing protein [Sphingobium nicotianae]MBT2188267.1 DUF3237 family protein [Sphingobium nicotianae]